MNDTITIGDTTIRAHRAESRLAQARGHMFRLEPPDWALVFERDDVQQWAIHMLFVPFALEVAFVVDGVVDRVAELAPWTGAASGEAETIVEVPAGMIDAEPGMEVAL